MNKKGYIYTLLAIILILVLIFFILFYSRFTETEIEDITGKISCDELHFIVENTKVDLNRSLAISGRRAAIYAIDSVVYRDIDFEDYNSSYFPELNGSVGAVADLFFNGTLNINGNVTPSDYMINNTLSEWMNKMDVKSGEIYFNTNISVINLTIKPYDAWNFIIDVNFTFQISDENEMCFYKNNISIYSISSIEGLEDPLYSLNTMGAVTKPMERCDSTFSFNNIESGSEGWSWASGNPIFALNEGEIASVVPNNANKSNILIIRCIDYLTSPTIHCVNYTTYGNYMEDYAGIITVNYDTDTLNGLKKLDIPYLAGATNISNLIALNLSENYTVVSDGSQFYFVNLDYFGTPATCNSRGIWWNEIGNRTGTQTGWFSELNQTDDSIYPSNPVKFLFPTFNEPGKKLCEIAPQLESNNTWQYFLGFPLKSKNLHLIATSDVTQDYKVTIYYTDNSTDNYTTRIQSSCTSGKSVGECINCYGRGYDSHYVSRNNNFGYVFEDVFWSVSNSTCASPGITVQHITIPLDAYKYVGGMSIHDPDNSTDGPKPVIWAVTLETAPRSVLVINASIQNNSLFGCYRDSNVCPSFFDKLEGRYNISDKYKNMSPEGVKIGLESFVNVSRIESVGLDIHLDRTALDCLYFEGKTPGYKLKGLDNVGLNDFRIHESYTYNATGDYRMGDLSYDLIVWEYVTPEIEVGIQDRNWSDQWWPPGIPPGGPGGGGGEEEEEEGNKTIYPVISGEGTIEVDRDSGSVVIDDSVTLTAKLGENKDNVFVTFYAKLMDPDAVGQNITKTLGTDTTDSSGYASIAFNPGSSYYAGDYTWWPEAWGYETIENETLIIYGALNTSFKYSNANPNATYNATNNDTIIIDALLDSLGPETNMELKFNYMEQGYAKLTEPGGIEHVVELSDRMHSWWNFSYQYIRQLNVTTTDPIEENYSVKFTINTTGDEFKDDGSDLRVLYFNGTNYIELDRVNETPFNSTETEIWFKIQKNITDYDDEYWLYYGNLDAGSPPSNKSNIYLWWDDFSTDTTGNYDIGRHALNWHGNMNYSPIYDGTEQAVYFNATATYTGDWMPLNISEKDVLAEMTMKVIRTYEDTADNNATNGILLRWAAKNKFYAGHISGGEHDSPCISENKRDPRNECKTLPNEYFPINGTVFKLTAAIWDDNIKLWYNDVEKVSTNDSTISDAGSIAFVVSHSEGWMDNFKIRRYTESEPTVSIVDIETIAPEFWNGTFQLNQNLSRGVWNVTLNATADYFVSVTASRSFNVTGGVEPASFNIWDQEDDSEDMPPPPVNWTEEAVTTNESTYFWANYTNYTNGAVITDATCRIWFNSTGWANMSYNSSWQLYYYNRSFSQAGNYEWNVSCSKEEFRSREGSSTVDAVFPTNLEIMDDENETNIIYMLENTFFWANYTNYTNGAVITNATCRIWFNDTGWISMDYNSTEELYYYNRSFLESGNYTWNVTCSKTYYESKANFSNISVETIVVTLVSPASLTTLDRDSVNATVSDEVTIIANLNDERENITVTFYANLTEPISISNIAIGTNTSNSTGYASFIWNPSASYYAGNYTCWAEADMYERASSQVLYVYGGLNLSFRYSDVNPNATYNATNNETVIIDAILHSLGPESDFALNNTYNASVEVVLTEPPPNRTNYTVNLTYQEV